MGLLVRTRGALNLEFPGSNFYKETGKIREASALIVQVEFILKMGRFHAGCVKITRLVSCDEAKPIVSEANYKLAQPVLNQ